MGCFQPKIEFVEERTFSRANDEVLWTLFDIPSIEEGGVKVYLNTILSKCSRIFASTVSSVFVDNGKGELECMASLGADLAFKAKIKVGVGIAGSALQHGVALIVNDPLQEVLLAGQVQHKRQDVGSAMVIPLISNERKLGVLNLARKKEESGFSEDDLRKANSLAHQISLAVANWHLIGEIQSAHDQIQSVFDLLNVAVLVWDGERIDRRNPEAERMLGTGSFEEIIQSLPEPLGRALLQARSEAEYGQVKKFQVDHQQISWILNASPLPGLGVLFMIEDISLAVQTSHELSRVRRLAEIGQLTAAIAHEIRNPLTGIRSAAQMITIAPEQSEVLAKIVEEEAIKLNDLCSHFLDFARPVEPNLNPYDLTEIATRLASVHQSDFDQAKVQLKIETTAPCLKEIDKNQIEQVMRNFLLNSLQATSEGGSVCLIIHHDGFEVSDTGIGMDKSILESLFTPFFSTKAKGTGLGLSNCRKLIEAHGGSIEVTSEVGKGSSFRVRLAEDLLRVA
jgi:signal transduction histidine kinase